MFDLPPGVVVEVVSSANPLVVDAAGRWTLNVSSPLRAKGLDSSAFVACSVQIQIVRVEFESSPQPQTDSMSVQESSYAPVIRETGRAERRPCCLEV